MQWLKIPIEAPCERSRRQALTRQQNLTKPAGSLGRLEHIAVRMSAIQGSPSPGIDRVHICIFAADHGVVAEGVSRFPQSVTASMVRNFVDGGAAINVLARAIDATLEVVDVGLICEPASTPTLIRHRAGAGTGNIAHTAAMSADQLIDAMDAGKAAAERAAGCGCDLFVGGEMGIGNTTSASALACAFTGVAARSVVGPGTGLNAAEVAHKVHVVEQALGRLPADCAAPLEFLRNLGGFEIAALTAAYLRCAQLRIPLLIDGFISSVAALVAQRILPAVSQWMFFAHRSAEPGHQVVLEAMSAEPVVSLGMRLGEASGAAVVVPILRMACMLQTEMATFEEAGVGRSNGS